MSEHARWQALAATRVDFALRVDDAASLADHQAGCAECRTLAAGLRADAHGLRTLEFGPTPTRLRVRVAEGAAVFGGGRPSLGALLVAAVLLLIVTLAGMAAVGAVLNQRPSLPLVNGNQVQWKTAVVDLRASDFWIETAGKRYQGTTAMAVDSDPGSATYRTLEVTWHEHGSEMRVYIYFGGDATTWWIDEIRTYDGAAQNPDWLYYRAPEIRAPLGQAWEGTVELRSARSDRPGRGPGTLHFGSLMVASVAADTVNEPPGGGIVLKENADPFRPGGLLHCTDILQLPPKEAENVLLGLGYKLSWRLSWSTGSNTGFSQLLTRAPEGFISSTAVGSSGELIVFVEDPARPMGQPATFPADCPQPAHGVTPAP